MSLPTAGSTSTMQTLPPQEVAALAHTYGRTVFLAAYRLLGDAQQAEDVQQDVFLRLLERPMEDVASWPAFLSTLAVRQALDRLRSRQRWRRLLPLWRMAGPSHAASAESNALQAEKASQLRWALARLRPREAQCFTLRCVQGLDIGAIAAATGMTANHVGVCLHRATRHLRDLLDDAEPTLPETQP